jgi:hypothetical protein
MTILYRFYGENNALLYIGISDKWISRMKQHSYDKPWFEDVETVRIQRFSSRPDALAAERAAIHAEHPKHNVAHNTESERQRYDWKISVNTAMRVWAEDARSQIDNLPHQFCYGTEQTAAILGMPYRVVEGMIASGHLESIKIGTTEVVPYDCLVGYVDKIAGEVT